jgi:hypothetical protein
MIDHRSGGGRQQQGTEPPALQGVGHVEIVEEGTPRRIVVEVGVDKADDVAAKVSDDCPMVGIRSRQAGAPHIPSIIEYFTVQEGVRIGAAIISAPTVGVEGGDLLGVAEGGTADPDAACHHLLIRGRCGTRSRGTDRAHSRLGI